MRKLLWFCCFFWLCLWANPSKAKDLIEHSAWLEDVSGQMTLADVQQRSQAFLPYQGVLTQGFSASTLWVKIRIGPTTDHNLILRIRPSYLDHIELHDPIEGTAGSLSPRLSGDHHPKEESEYGLLNHGFFIQGSHSPRDIYLRLQSTSSLMADAQVLTVNQAANLDSRQELLYGIYLGLFGAITVWAVLQWLSYRENLMTFFVVKQVLVLGYALAFLGYLPLLFVGHLEARTLSDITSLLVLLYVLSNAVFLLMLLREFNPVPWLWWLITVMQAAYVGILGLFMWGEARLALQMNVSLGALDAVGLVLLAFSARGWKDKIARNQPPLPRQVLIGFSLAQLAATFLSALPLLNFFQAAEWNLNAPILTASINGVLMIVMMSFRAQNLDKLRQKMMLETNLLEQQARTERERREEQARFLSMLTHELKTPLAVARICLDDSSLSGLQRERIDRALANINGIIDRCSINERLEHHKLTPLLQPCNLHQVLNECVISCNNPSRVKVSERNESVVETDSGLLAICLANLIDNALKYSPPGSPIDVRLLSAPEGHTITVRNAIGSAGAPDPLQLYTKYYRSLGALSKSGSGLGLYLARNLANLIGVQMSHRVHEQHVEFNLWLPA